jgi:hypothetical protein
MPNILLVDVSTQSQGFVPADSVPLVRVTDNSGGMTTATVNVSALVSGSLLPRFSPRILDRSGVRARKNDGSDTAQFLCHWGGLSAVPATAMRNSPNGIAQ